MVGSAVRGVVHFTAQPRIGCLGAEHHAGVNQVARTETEGIDDIVIPKRIEVEGREYLEDNAIAPLEWVEGKSHGGDGLIIRSAVPGPMHANTEHDAAFPHGGR